MRFAYALAPVLMAALCIAAPVVAQTPTPAAPSAADIKKADELFRDANRLVLEQKWQEAETKYAGAWALNPSYDVALNLGQTQYRLGKNRDAAEHLAFAVRNWPLVGKREPRDIAEKRLAELKKQITTLNVQVSVPGATILVDGKPVGRSPLDVDLFVEPGTRTIGATLAGYTDASEVIEAVKGGAKAVSLSLAPTTPRGGGPLPPPTATAPAGSAAPPRAALISAGVLGVAGLAVGGGLAAAANGKASTVHTQQTALQQGTGKYPCAGTSAPSGCTTLRDAAKTQQNLANAAFVSFVAGGTFALATAGLGVWTALAPKAGADTKPTVRVAPVVGAGEAGIVVVGRW
jgi:hypothetical protein